MTYTFEFPFSLLTEEQKSTIDDIDTDTVEIELDTGDLTDDQITYATKELDYIICDGCGEIIHRDDSYRILDEYGDTEYIVCEDCTSNYNWCEDTQGYYIDSAVGCLNPNTRYERYVSKCSNAWRDAYVCDHCGDRYDDTACLFVDDYRCICEDCYSYYDYSTCANCGQIIDSSETCYDEYDGCDYCEDCYTPHNARGITGYHHDNKQDKLTFNKMPEEDTELYMGVELEVESKEGHYPALDSVADDIHELCEDLIIKEDGSLDRGFEMVTQPCTIGYHLNRIPWAEICREALDSNMLSDKAKNCGLHVHVSRKALGSTEEAQDLTIAKMLILFDRFETQIENFARRKSNRWAAFYKTEGKDIERDMYYILKNKVGTGDRARYHAINLTNLHTVEFRAFKGSLNVETVKATIQFVYTFVNFAIKADLITVQNCEWQDICKDTEFTELRAYLNRRHLD